MARRPAGFANTRLDAAEKALAPADAAVPAPPTPPVEQELALEPPLDGVEGTGAAPSTPLGDGFTRMLHETGEQRANAAILHALRSAQTGGV